MKNFKKCTLIELQDAVDNTPKATRTRETERGRGFIVQTFLSSSEIIGQLVTKFNESETPATITSYFIAVKS